MSNPVECPFCGETFYRNFQGIYVHTLVTSNCCPLDGRALSEQQWNMRPPKKEIGHTPRTTLNELEQYLLALVKELSLIRASKE